MANASEIIVNYLKESREELKKVVWPTRKETVRLTVVVVAVSAALALFLGGVDYVFNVLLQKLLNVV